MVRPSKEYAASTNTVLDDSLIAEAAKWNRPGLPHPSLVELRELAAVEPATPLRVVSVRAEGQLVALAVCHVEQARIHGITLTAYRAFGAKLHDYARLYADDPAAMSYLMEQLRMDAKDCGADVVHLKNLIELDIAVAIPAGFSTVEDTKLFDAALATKGWQEILERKSVKRDWSRVARMADYRVETIVGELSRDEVEDLAAMHRERWLFAGVRSAFIDMRRIDEYMCHPGNKVLTRVWLGSEILCCHFGMIYGDLMLFHTPVINVKYLDLSPLKTLLAETVGFCAARGLRCLDLGLGDESYKEYSANATRRVHEFILPVSWRGRVVAALHHQGRAEKAKILLIRASAVTRRASGFVTSRVKSVQLHELDPGPVLDSETVGELVCFDLWTQCADFRRQQHSPLCKADYQRFKAGWRFIALQQNGHVKASVWIRPGGEIRCCSGRSRSIPSSLVLDDIVTREGGEDAIVQLLSGLRRSYPTERLVTITGPGSTGLRRILSRLGFAIRSTRESLVSNMPPSEAK